MPKLLVTYGTNHMLNILKEVRVGLKMYDFKKLDNTK